MKAQQHVHAANLSLPICIFRCNKRKKDDIQASGTTTSSVCSELTLWLLSIDYHVVQHGSTFSSAFNRYHQISTDNHYFPWFCPLLYEIYGWYLPVTSIGFDKAESHICLCFDKVYKLANINENMFLKWTPKSCEIDMAG